MLDEMKQLVNSSETRKRRELMKQQAILQKKLTDEKKKLEKILKIDDDANSILATRTPSVNDPNTHGQIDTDLAGFLRNLEKRNQVDEEKRVAQQELNVNQGQIADAKKRLPEVQQSIKNNTGAYEQSIAEHFHLHAALQKKKGTIFGEYQERSDGLNNIEKSMQDLIDIVFKEHSLHVEFGLKGCLDISRLSNVEDKKSALMAFVVLLFCIGFYYAANVLLRLYW